MEVIELLGPVIEGSGLSVMKMGKSWTFRTPLGTQAEKMVILRIYLD